MFVLLGTIGPGTIGGRVALSESLNSHSEPVISLEDDERWLLVQRVASSRHLVKAPQLRDILVYISRRVLADPATTIGEQEIGCKVLGRRPDFSPNEDNIVRVQIRHLRKRLEDYFGTEGVDEPIVLTIPKGGYLPHFDPRPEHAAQDAIAAPAEIPAPTLNFPVADAPPPKAGRSRRATALLALLLAGVAVGALVLWRHPAVSRPAPVGEEAPAEQSARTTERQVNRKDCIDTIIERKVLPPMRRFRMAQLELSSLQSGVGARYAVEPAILALPDFAPRQISKRTCRTHGQGSAATDCDWRRLAARSRPLGSCGFARRGARRQRIGGADTTNFP